MEVEDSTFDDSGPLSFTAVEILVILSLGCAALQQCWWKVSLKLYSEIRHCQLFHRKERDTPLPTLSDAEDKKEQQASRIEVPRVSRIRKSALSDTKTNVIHFLTLIVAVALTFHLFGYMATGCSLVILSFLRYKAGLSWNVLGQICMTCITSLIYVDFSWKASARWRIPTNMEPAAEE